MMTFVAGRSEVILTKDDEEDDIIYVTQPWKSPDWRQLYPIITAVKDKFGGKTTGDGFSDNVRHPSRDEWERKFKLDNGEA
ncbi:MAG: hypothetical protein Q8K86_07290 [Candidatus Nanopelagicaceae bacterium]|nr:hypothetical protein [Candidatus Nanopelagicaceae bacterium]